MTRNHQISFQISRDEALKLRRAETTEVEAAAVAVVGIEAVLLTAAVDLSSLRLGLPMTLQ
jgi:hypothetical protein